MSDSWKAPYRQGILSFRANKLLDALDFFSQAIERGPHQFAIYDSRAAVYQRLAKPKDALRDAKHVIDLSPERWQGYYRSSHLFLQLNKHDAASRMVQLALDRVPAHDDKRRTELVALQERITQDAEKRRQIASQSFYHFGKLPLEIAIAIFTLVLQEDRAAVVSLAAVCKDWRIAVLGTPTFWSTLVLTAKRPLRKAKIWRERSKGRLLELCLRRDFFTTSVDPGEVKDLPMESLRVLKVDALSYTWVDKFLMLLPAELWRNLYELDLSSTVIMPLALWNQPDMQLRRLSLKQLYLSWADTAKQYRHLEHVVYHGSLQELSIHNFLLLLHNNPSIQKLVLHLANSRPSPPFESPLPPTLEFPSLAELEIADEDVYISRLFPRFALPSLRRIALVRARAVDAFLHHLLRSGHAAQLVEFRAQQSALTAAVVVAFLRAAVALETLELSHIGGNQATSVLEALATPTAAPPPQGDQGDDTARAAPQFLCPSLRHANFSHCPDIKSGPLVRLVKSRLAPAEPNADDAGGAVRSNAGDPDVAPIETLVVDACPAVDADILPWLRSKVPVVSCVYMTKKQAQWKR
ncbi:hypothetical protein B0H21DRAFT_884393 [Amylocystis lapponica]|nr:hypothetical protein B0H21DRAFT_884393 [Amylocystis lapponica]